MALKRRNKQCGIGLLEVLLVLAIAATIIILSTRYFYLARQNQNLATTIAVVGDIHKAAVTYAKRKDYIGTNLTIENLKNSGLLTTVQSQNPWGGNLSIAQGGTNNNQLVITMEQVPTDICFEISKRLMNSTRPGESAVCNATTLTVSYDLF